MDFDQEYLKAKIMKSGDQPLDMRLDSDGVMRYYLPSAELEVQGDEAAAVQEEKMLPPVEVVARRPKAAKPPVPQPTQGQLDLGEAKPIDPAGAMGALKKVGQAIQSGADAIDFDVLGLPGIGTLTLKDLTVGDLGKVLVDIAEGFPPVSGSGQTLKPTPDALELINVAPAATGAVKLGRKAVSLIPSSAKKSLIDEVLGADAKEQLLRKFVGFLDTVSVSEKLSDPKTWTAAEQKAWDAGDWKSFSKLRGYTNKQISDFQSYLDLSAAVDKKYGSDTAQGIIAAYNDVVKQRLKTKEQK